MPDTVLLRANDCATGLPDAFDADGDGASSCGPDCDDSDSLVGPGRPERVNGVDDDGDGEIDEGTAVTDDDGDGNCDDALTCDDGSLPGDCDDTDPAIAPGTPELPNRRDDDCDGAVDEGTIYADDDGDGFTEQGGDCDDGDAGKSPALGTCG